MDPIPPPPPEDPEPESARADWLVSDEGPSVPSPIPPAPAPAASDEGYAIDGMDPEAEEASPPSPLAPPIPPVPRPKTLPESKTAAKAEPRPVATVEETWSRWGEWGPTLTLLGAVSLGLGLLLYLAIAAGAYSLAFLVFAAGGAALVVLSYPIVITLERPVRVTPEQAVKDFYAALSHHLPHYRRMWLLLSSAGRQSGPFASLEGFRAYWNERIARLSGAESQRFSPLTFEVQDFRAGKSAGQSSVDAAYTVDVVRRSAASEGPIASFRIETGLVRGEDRMWYLNAGTLPDGPPDNT